MPSFASLDLNPKILEALEKKGYTTPTPIQDQSIPHLLKGKDILGIAQTGTGKTAAFSLPILNNLTKSANRVKPNQVRALILTPTRELASQIAENIGEYGKDLALRHTVVFGGVGIGAQIRAMSQGVDILIATPGRLLDLMTQGHIRYANLEVFVLDEADRMLDMGFFNDVKKIIKKLPVKRQTLFFSATMPTDIADLADSILTDPAKVEITPQATTVDRIDQSINLVEKGNKLLLLKKTIKNADVSSVLVFSKTKHGANRIVQYLEGESIKVAAIHGNKSQAARERALNGFRNGSIQALVATDIAARGIDVPGISHVINFDIPNDPESYVHRIGRTARAGKEGVAISFCDPSEIKLLRAVEKTIKYNIPVDTTHPLHGVAASPSTKGSATRRSDSARVAKARGESSRAANAARSGRSARFEESNSSSRDAGRDNRRRDSRNSQPRHNNGNTSFSNDSSLGEDSFNRESANVNRPAFSGRSEYSPKFGANGKRLNKDSSRFSSNKERSYAGDRPRYSSDRDGNSASYSRSSTSSGSRSYNRNSRSNSSSSSLGNSEIYVPAKEGRRAASGENSGNSSRGNSANNSGSSSGSKGRNFSYAGVRERKHGSSSRNRNNKRPY